ncbi:MAG: class I SAM-dependent methyltransferase [Saprospiraceae bacterium]|nr:class I SAM-dependent methyltransferase [Saprospiraceae bacterium]
MNAAPNYYTNHRREMLPALPSYYSKVLEIGCGKGRFRANLEQPHEYWGLEPVPAAAEEARAVLDKVLKGTYEEQLDQLPEAYFDLIICNDVIEHMMDHDFFFRSIQSKLTSAGVLVASVPNVRHILHLYELLVQKDWQYKDDGILDRTHYRFFTEKSLRSILEQHHYQIEYFQGINKYEGDSFIKGLFGRLVSGVLGKDTLYLQFAIRIKRKKN